MFEFRSRDGIRRWLQLRPQRFQIPLYFAPPILRVNTVAALLRERENGEISYNFTIHKTAYLRAQFKSFHKTTLVEGQAILRKHQMLRIEKDKLTQELVE